MRDFDDNDFPLAYLITFRCYGTWLHGDERGSVDRKHNLYGTPKISTNPALQGSDSKQRKQPPSILGARQRRVVENAVRDACDYRKYTLRAINVRTNHAHTVVSAMQKPELVLTTFKSYSTRALREAGLLSAEVKPWARHGSTIYLWKDQDVAKAVAYVLLNQGNETIKYALPDGRATAPFVAAQRGFIDEVIEPAQTRPKLIRALSLLENKRDQNPPKKQGTYLCNSLTTIMTGKHTAK